MKAKENIAFENVKVGCLFKPHTRRHKHTYTITANNAINDHTKLLSAFIRHRKR